MSVEHIGKELADIVNLTAEGTAAALADSEVRTTAGQRIAALHITLAE